MPTRPARDRRPSLAWLSLVALALTACSGARPAPRVPIEDAALADLEVTVSPPVHVVGAR